jgi:hypothetical protein
MNDLTFIRIISEKLLIPAVLITGFHKSNMEIRAIVKPLINQ